MTDHPNQHDGTCRTDARHPLAKWGYTGLVVALGLGLTLGVAWRYRCLAAASDSLHLDRLVARGESEIRSSLQVYEETLRDAAGFFAASADVSRDEWSRYVATTGAIKRCAGAITFGVIFPVSDENLDEFVARQRATGAPEFTAQRVPRQSTTPMFALRPAQPRASEQEPLCPPRDRFIVTYRESVAPLAPLLGMDFSSEDVRRVASELSRDTGTPVLTERLQLVVEEHRGRPGFVYMYPVYAYGAPTATVEQRRAALTCWVYLAGIYPDMISSISGDGGPMSHEVRFEMFNGERPDPESLVAGSVEDDRPPFDRVSQLAFGGRSFTIGWSVTPEFVRANPSLGLWIHIGGLAIIMLGAVFTFSLLSQSERIRGQVADRTANLSVVFTALVESEDRFRRAVEGASVGIWDWDVETNENYFSPRFKELLGYGDVELPNVQAAWSGLLHPEDSERVRAAIASHLESRTPYGIEYRLLCKDGTYRWFQARGQATWDHQGKPLKMAGSLVDIDSRKRMERERDQVIEAQQRSAERELLLRREVDHRVRNNLVALHSLVRMYQETGRDAAKMADGLRGKIAAMRDVHTLLSQAQQRPLEIASVVERLSVSAIEQGATIRLNGPRILIPPQQAAALAMVVEELFMNARKHGALRTRAGRIDVSWETLPQSPGPALATAGPGRVGEDISDGDQLRFRLRWVEHSASVQVESKPAPRGLSGHSSHMGWKLIEGLAGSDLRGRCTFDLKADGLTFELVSAATTSPGLPLET